MKKNKNKIYIYSLLWYFNSNYTAPEPKRHGNLPFYLFLVEIFKSYYPLEPSMEHTYSNKPVCATKISKYLKDLIVRYYIFWRLIEDDQLTNNWKK